MFLIHVRKRVSFACCDICDISKKLFKAISGEVQQTLCLCPSSTQRQVDYEEYCREQFYHTSSCVVSFSEDKRKFSKTWTAFSKVDTEGII